jgi:uncharacterized protein YecE (DUF72 family)
VATPNVNHTNPTTEGRDVFAYFNNDEIGYAPRNALRLRELASL